MVAIVPTSAGADRGFGGRFEDGLEHGICERCLDSGCGHPSSEVSLEGSLIYVTGVDLFTGNFGKDVVALDENLEVADDAIQSVCPDLIAVGLQFVSK